MSFQYRMDRALRQAKPISFDDTSKFFLCSDCHRGDNSFADDFARNRNIYYHALKYYYNHGFTYIELGDGDELWENLKFKFIFRAHREVFFLLQKFYAKDRMAMIWGNHDMVYREESYVKKNLYSYFDHESNRNLPLFPDIKFNEAILLQHKNTQQKLLLLHGHQADFMNYKGWRINRFLVQVLWKPLQLFGIADPTSPAQNFRETIKVERRIKKWMGKHKNLAVIIGHTHRPRFPEVGHTPLFNTGSCVHPRSITGIEIQKGEITLIKWEIQTTEQGVLRIIRKPLEKSSKLTNFVV